MVPVNWYHRLSGIQCHVMTGIQTHLGTGILPSVELLRVSSGDQYVASSDKRYI